MFAKLNNRPDLAPRANTPEENAKEQAGRSFWMLSLGALGVVYGDIGTSPLYALKESAKTLGGDPWTLPPDEIYGAVSLILWSLFIIVTLKYVLLLLYADNRGEGGILTLATLARKDGPKRLRPIILLGLIGAALFYGDAAVTPAISVMSSVGVLHLVWHGADRWEVPASFVILFLLFVTEKEGTRKIAWLFGPIMLLWMLTTAGLAVPQIVKDPHILLALSPVYAFHTFGKLGWKSFDLLAMAFLSVTGAEALYADLGHFGRKPIKLTWLFLVFPALALNYLAQGSLLIANEKALENPFVYLAPHCALWPVVILSMLATIIASQAVITGAYSLTAQAFELGLVPRLVIHRTGEGGQIYMPQVNRMLMIMVLLVVLIFRNADNASSAYGIAVSGTMLATTMLAYIVIRNEWKWSVLKTGAVLAPFIMAETVFFAANLTKFFSGGFVPLIFTLLLSVVMIAWVRGSRCLRVRGAQASVLLKDIGGWGDPGRPVLPGTAVFLTGNPYRLTRPLAQSLKEHGLHEQTIILNAVIQHIPEVPKDKRYQIDRLTPNVTRVVAHLGYEDDPDMPKLLAEAPGLNADLARAQYHVTRRHVTARPRQGLHEGLNRIFIQLKKGAAKVGQFYHLPPGRIVNVEQEIEI